MTINSVLYRIKQWFNSLFGKTIKIESSFKPYTKEQLHESTILDALNHAEQIRGKYREWTAAQDSAIGNQEALKAYVLGAIENPEYGRTFGLVTDPDSPSAILGMDKARSLGNGDIADLVAQKYREDKKEWI